MIRADTAPGTEVICIDAEPGPYGDVGLTRGALYTVDRITVGIGGDPLALLTEIAPRETYAPPWGLVTLGFALRRFRYLDLPDELTRLIANERVVA